MSTYEGDDLLKWAYFGHFPNALRDLAKLALKENWEYKKTTNQAKKEYPILRSYLIYTFGRLRYELKSEPKKILEKEKQIAVFDTGLVNKHYDKIYAVFTPNEDPRNEWKFNEFCISGEGRFGKEILNTFGAPPLAANYFDEPSDLIYDVRKGAPNLDKKHIITDNIDRYPTSFLIEELPSEFEHKDTSQMDWQAKKMYYDSMRQIVDNDSKIYRSISRRIVDAIDLAIKKISWNYKTAIPMYYPVTKKMGLLLPICLDTEEKVDMALVVERLKADRPEDESYFGHTVLKLDWAYSNARLVCRPESHWLANDNIDEIADEKQMD